MKKTLLILLILFTVTPIISVAQKQTKEEKAAIARAAYDVAVKCVDAKDFVIVPSSYTDKEGMIEANTDNSNFLSFETKKLFLQGDIVCDNRYTNIAEATEYIPSFDKKGNLRLRIVVMGRMVKGTYIISMRSNDNMADVIFTPQSGVTRKFSGPIVPLNAANYNKRSNPM